MMENFKVETTKNQTKPIKYFIKFIKDRNVFLVIGLLNRFIINYENKYQFFRRTYIPYAT